MPANAYSTSGMLEDLIRSFVQLSALELHAKTAVEIAENELLEAEADELSEKSAKVSDSRQRALMITSLRRDAMLLIASKSNGDVDRKEWCMVKHSAMAMITAFESWQADSKNNKDSGTVMYDYWVSTNNLFIDSISRFLGLDIEPCASCFSDALKDIGVLDE